MGAILPLFIGTPMANAKNAADGKLPFYRKVLFGVGDSTNSLFFTVIAFFYLFFLTDVAGIAPALAGWVLLAGKAWDAVTDPMMGFVSDHTKSRWGRRRPYFLASVPAAVLFYFIWVAYPIENQTLLFLTYAGLNLLFWTFFTMMAIPYSALMPELSLDYDDRTSLVSVRMAFSIVFGLLAAVVPMEIVALYPDRKIGFAMMALFLGAFGIVPYVISFFGTRERPEYQQKASLPFFVSLKETMKNRSYVVAMIVFLLSWVCVDVIGAVFIYFIIYWMGLSENDVSILLGIIFITAVLVLPFWVLVSKKVGKKAAYVIGMSFWAVVMSLAYFLHPGLPSWILYLFCFLAGFGVSTAHIIPWSMIIDCIDIDEYRTGARREGMYTGFTLFTQKLASSVALLLVGAFLGWAGYVANVAQKESALIAIRVLLGPIPAGLLILSIVCALMYPITKSGHAKIREELDRRAHQVTGGTKT
jgi:sugar (glycoside-pentoside-hexuronide) transporter